jgi:hypothetical protein
MAVGNGMTNYCTAGLQKRSLIVLGLALLATTAYLYITGRPSWSKTHHIAIPHGLKQRNARVIALYTGLWTRAHSIARSSSSKSNSFPILYSNRIETAIEALIPA